MALFAEKIAASVVSDILKKLSSYPEKKIIGIWKVEKEFQKLEKTLKMLLAALREVEKRQDNPEYVSCWLERLKDAAYEADDVLGQFSFEAVRMGIDMRIDSSKMEKVRSFFSDIHAVKFRSKMADKIKKIYKKLDDIEKDMKSFGYTPRGENIDHSENDRSSLIITSPFVEDLHFEGRKEEISKLIDILTGPSEEETISVVSIVGIGGLGKTTLARKVYKHDSVKKYFDKQMWVCVLRDFGIRKLREGMVESLTGVKPQPSETTDEAIQKKLDENLGRKKFLLVLDNVWEADIGGWELLRDSLKMGIQQGSKIIVTTRDATIASIIKTHDNEPFVLKGLSQDESWSLFEKRAFAVGGAKKNTNTERRGRELVQKCKGVPLAIQSLGALMHSKKTDLQWESIQFSQIWKLEGQDNISAVLKLSYHDMPPPLKRCFSYCSIFPKGHEIVKKTLIQLWMAEGLLQSSSSDDKLMEDVGEEYFKSLLWISFFQDVVKDKLGEELECKMHDLVHDLAQNIMANECMIIKDFDNKDKPKVGETRYLLVVCPHKETIREEFNKMEKVRAYLYLGGSDYFADLIHISAEMFSNFRNLRALDLTNAGIRSLSSSVGELKQLRYLDVSENKIATFPDSITTLYNLQTLKMLDMGFDSILLPKGITKMINLRHLEVDQGLRFPKGIRQLTNLQTLRYFTATKDPEAAGTEELGDLRQLGGSLELDNLNGQIIIKNDTAANLKEKPRLKKLQLIFVQDWSDGDNKLLESLQPHPSLISLNITRFRGSEPPTWLDGSGTSHLSFLQYLNLEYCPNIKSLSLAGLCSLRRLVIRGCPNLSLGVPKGLTALEDIRLMEGYERGNPINSLMSLGCPEDGMPDLISLKTLTMDGCHILAALPAGFFSFLTSLNTLGVGKSQILGTLPKRMGIFSSLSCKALLALPQSLGNLSSLRVLKIKTCHGLKALPEGLGNLSSLEHLNIEDTCTLTKLPESFGNLSSLQELYIINCEGLVALPTSFGNLSALQNLSMNYCESLAALPQNFGNLSALQNMSMNHCESLAAFPQNFGNLSALQNLSINHCESLAALPQNFGNLSALRNLTIDWCGSLAALPQNFGSLSALQNLSINHCESLAALPQNFGNLSALGNLTIDWCGSLAVLPESLGKLLALKNLTIMNCGSLTALPKSFGKLSSLDMLRVSHCKALTALSESLGDLSSLKMLEISYCPNLTYLAERICSLTSLKELHVQGCKMKSFPDGMQDLISLRILDLQNLGNLEALPDGLINLSSLRELRILDCSSLKSLPDCFKGLTSLERLDICLKKLVALPESLGKLSSLQHLTIDRCNNLNSLPESLGELSSLQQLTIEGCNNLNSLPESLGELSSLQQLTIDGCKELNSLPRGLQNLRSLRTLSMKYCPQLKKRYRRRKLQGWPRIISHIPHIVF